MSVRPRLKLRSVAAGTMAPELVCWPISSKKTCRREPSTVSLKQQACPAGQLCCCPVSLQRRCSQHGQSSCLGACKRSRMGPFLLERPMQVQHAPQSAWRLAPATLGHHLQETLSDVRRTTSSLVPWEGPLRPGRSARQFGLIHRSHVAPTSQDRSDQCPHLGISPAEAAIGCEECDSIACTIP